MEITREQYISALEIIDLYHNQNKIPKDIKSLDRNDYVIYNGGSNSKNLIKGSMYRVTGKPWSSVIAIEAENGKRFTTKQRYFSFC